MTIDFHVHAFNPKIAEKAVSKLAETAKIKPYTYGLIDETIDRFDRWGVDKGVLLPIATKPSQHKIINDWAAQQDGDRIISFGSVHPEGEDALDELEKIKDRGLHGVKLHPDYQGFMIDEKKLEPVYEEIERLGLPVVFHAGFDCISPDLIHCPPERSVNVCKRHKHMKMVLAHLGGNQQWQQVYDILAGLDGELYFDTAFSMECDSRLMEKIINKHGAERILFASDCPWESSAKLKEKILSLNISDDKKEKILGGNALRLLGMKA